MGLVLMFDADDTLWENNVRFDRVVDDFIAWLAHPMLDEASIRAVLRDVELVPEVAETLGTRARRTRPQRQGPAATYVQRPAGALLMSEQNAKDRAPAVSCVFVCHDGSGRVLLARRSSGARDEPGTWDTGAGALEFGETFEAAVSREVQEEYSTQPLDVTILGVRNVLRDDPPSHWVAVTFAVRVDPTTVSIGEPHKFDELGWFTADALPEPVHSQLLPTLALLSNR